jgi:hypothetical protein
LGEEGHNDGSKKVNK